MADDFKVKITKEISKVDIPKQTQKIQSISPSQPGVKEKAEISDTAKILTEFVPKVLSAIDKPQERESKPASNSEIASALLEELVKTILAKKIKD